MPNRSDRLQSTYEICRIWRRKIMLRFYKKKGDVRNLRKYSNSRQLKETLRKFM